MQAQIEFLARDFGGEQARGNVGGLVFGIKPRAFRHFRRAPRTDIGHAIAFQRGDQEHFLEHAFGIELFHQRQKRFALHAVDLVEDQRRFLVVRLQTIDNHVRIARGKPIGLEGQCGRIHDQADRIGIARPRPRGFHHRAVELAARLEDARRIHEHDLRFAAHGHPAHRHARGLHLGRDDGDFRPHQRVDERGFARIRRADDGREPAMGHASPNRASMRLAASCSASRLDPPNPVSASWPCTLTSTAKRGA